MKKQLILALLLGALPVIASPAAFMNSSLAQDTLADQLGWVVNNQNQCGGYYLEPSFAYPISGTQKNTLAITGNEGTFSLKGTSILEGKVTITRSDQQITSQKGVLYRDPATGKLTSLDLIGNVHLREPNTLIVAAKGNYNFQTGQKTLYDILYRTVIHGKEVVGPKSVSRAAIQADRKITDTTAWGGASEFTQEKPRIYELTDASYSTCSPVSPAWRLKASHIALNKETGRGYATNARLLVKGIPVFYTPYVNFPLDKRRKTGFLWPTVGVGSGNKNWGPYALIPFYWNTAPNYDTTLTLGILTKRGTQLTDNFRYLTPINEGNFSISVLPSDSVFEDQQIAYREEYSSNTTPAVQAELNRLLNSSSTRRSLQWHDNAQFNPNWSSHIDFNYAGDDYYTQDFGNDLDENTQNQLLQQADLNYKGPNWNFTGRIQAYQTLHPLQIDQTPFQNQYRRFPQLILNGDYPEQAYGLDYFINNEATHFDIRNTPGTTTNQPIGNRLHTQPGVSVPLMWPYFYVTPRAQLALTHYDLYQTTPTNTPDIHRRAIPIFDVLFGSALIRDTRIFNHGFEQTLEPQIYYTFIPYRNQDSIPVFDTTVNTLTYDQIFNFNRFSGIDRIGDANQVGVGISSRLLDSESGLEKIRVGAGEIMYFSRRQVTLCNDQSCPDNPFNPANHWRLSPLSGVLDYHVNSSWSFSTNVIWSPVTKQLDNSVTSLQYKPDDTHIINFGYNFVRNGDPLSGITAVNSSQNNLKNTDFSFAWPVLRDFSAVGRWMQAWNTNHLQNLLYGIQYDTCCWAARFVGGRTFVGPAPNNRNSLQYSDQFYIQFSLKGLGDIGTGQPDSLLNSITGYKSHFGQDF